MPRIFLPALTPKNNALLASDPQQQQKRKQQQQPEHSAPFELEQESDQESTEDEDGRASSPDLLHYPTDAGVHPSCRQQLLGQQQERREEQRSIADGGMCAEKRHGSSGSARSSGGNVAYKQTREEAGRRLPILPREGKRHHEHHRENRESIGVTNPNKRKTNDSLHREGSTALSKKTRPLTNSPPTSRYNNQKSVAPPPVKSSTSAGGDGEGQRAAAQPAPALKVSYPAADGNADPPHTEISRRVLNTAADSNASIASTAPVEATTSATGADCSFSHKISGSSVAAAAARAPQASGRVGGKVACARRQKDCESPRHQGQEEGPRSSSTFAVLFMTQLLGITLAAAPEAGDDSLLVVCDIEESSRRVASSKLRVGDRLIAVGGTSTAGLSVDHVERLIVRGSRPLEVVFRRRSLSPPCSRSSAPSASPSSSGGGATAIAAGNNAAMSSAVGGSVVEEVEGGGGGRASSSCTRAADTASVSRKQKHRPLGGLERPSRDCLLDMISDIATQEDSLLLESQPQWHGNRLHEHHQHRELQEQQEACQEVQQKAQYKEATTGDSPPQAGRGGGGGGGNELAPLPSPAFARSPSLPSFPWPRTSPITAGADLASVASSAKAVDAEGNSHLRYQALRREGPAPPPVLASSQSSSSSTEADMLSSPSAEGKEKVVATGVTTFSCSRRENSTAATEKPGVPGATGMRATAPAWRGDVLTAAQESFARAASPARGGGGRAGNADASNSDRYRINVFRDDDDDNTTTTTTTTNNNNNNNTNNNNNNNNSNSNNSNNNLNNKAVSFCGVGAGESGGGGGDGKSCSGTPRAARGDPSSSSSSSAPPMAPTAAEVTRILAKLGRKGVSELTLYKNLTFDELVRVCRFTGGVDLSKRLPKATMAERLNSLHVEHGALASEIPPASAQAQGERREERGAERCIGNSAPRGRGKARARGRGGRGGRGGRSARGVGHSDLASPVNPAHSSAECSRHLQQDPPPSDGFRQPPDLFQTPPPPPPPRPSFLHGNAQLPLPSPPVSSPLIDTSTAIFSDHTRAAWMTSAASSVRMNGQGGISRPRPTGSPQPQPPRSSPMPMTSCSAGDGKHQNVAAAAAAAAAATTITTTTTTTSGSTGRSAVMPMPLSIPQQTALRGDEGGRGARSKGAGDRDEDDEQCWTSWTFPKRAGNGSGGRRRRRREGRPYGGDGDLGGGSDSGDSDAEEAAWWSRELDHSDWSPCSSPTAPRPTPSRSSPALRLPRLPSSSPSLTSSPSPSTENGTGGGAGGRERGEEVRRRNPLLPASFLSSLSGRRLWRPPHDPEPQHQRDQQQQRSAADPAADPPSLFSRRLSEGGLGLSALPRWIMRSVRTIGTQTPPGW